MKLQICNAVTLFIIVINTLSVYGMEQNNYAVLAQEAAIYNCIHPLLNLPVEVQQQTIFSGYTDDWLVENAKLTKENMDELHDIIKTFFACTSVCKHFNKTLTLPWAGLAQVKKNEMLQKICSHMPVFNYNIYRMLPLAWVYSGAKVDTETNYWGTSLFKAVYETDESAVAMLLNYNADPYQLSVITNKLLCFSAKTIPIAQLFLAKVDKETLLSKFASASWQLAHSYYSPEIMEFWLDYGLSLYEYQDNNILHFLGVLFPEYTSTIDDFIKKVALLLARIPDKINVKDIQGRTFKDCVKHSMISPFYKSINPADSEKITELFIQYGAQTAQELEESAQ